MGFVENINKLAAESDNLIDIIDNIDSINTVSNNIDSVNIVADISTEIVNVSSISENIVLVDNNSENINTVADNIGDVSIVGNDLAGEFSYIEDNGSIADAVESTSGTSHITTVANDIDSVVMVAENIDNIINVSQDLSNINIVSAITDDITTVAGISTNVSTVAANNTNITTVATNISDVNTVAGIDTDISVVSGIASSIPTVAEHSNNVDIVAGSILDVSTVSSNISSVSTTANNISDIVIASTNIDSINTVATVSSDIPIVANISSDITTVSGISSNITFLAENWDDKINTADIGVTVQAYNANTVVDSEYVHTDNNYNDTAVSNLSDAYAHISSNGTDHSYIDQDVTTTGTPTFASIQLSGGIGTQGTVSWNSDEETLDLIQDGATLQLGQEVQVHCRNNTSSTIANGKVVMATGTLGASGRITIAPYDGTADVKYIVGIATEDIEADTDGKITAFGKVRGINTYSYNQGDILYPTTAGGLTATVPTSGIKNAIAIVINKHATQGTIMVRFTPIDENAYVPFSGNFTLDLGAL